MSRIETKSSRTITWKRRSRCMPAIAFFLVGCVSADPQAIDTPPTQALPPGMTVRPPAPPGSGLPTQVVTAGSAEMKPSSTRNDDLFAGMERLSEDEFVRQVRLRNPTVAQMTAAVKAATARYPQVASWEDPRAGATVGPASIGSPNVEFAYRLEISQAIPFPGKLGLRGESALREAAAAGADLDDTLLQLTESARNAFIDYFQVARAKEVNEEGLKLLREIRDNAATRYRNGQGEQQDVLQADVAIARQQEKASTLERVQRIAQARINTLLNRTPDHALPAPPKDLPPIPLLRPANELRESAIEHRPDITAMRARTAADESRVALALKEYYPDFEVMAAYDAFWQRPEQDLRPMVGFRLNLPVQMGRRDAAVAEGQARVAQRRAELARLISAIGLQVQEAYEQAKETERSLKLYEESALPAARENVRLARAAYATGKVPFLNLIEAQRNLVELRERQLELIAEARRRRAALDRAIGTSPGVEAGATPLLLPSTNLDNSHLPTKS